MKFNTLFMEAMKKASECNDLLILAEDNPERVLTDFFFGKCDNFLTAVFMNAEELTGESLEAHDLQDELYRILLPFLNKAFTGYELIYDSEKYPAPIQFFKGSDELGMLNIFNGSFHVITHEKLQKEKRLLKNMEKEFEDIQEEIVKYEGYTSKPMTYADTPLKKMGMGLRREHYKKEINTKYQDIVDKSMTFEKELMSQRVRLKHIEESLMPYEDEQEKIAGYFNKKYSYKINRDE